MPSLIEARRHVADGLRIKAVHEYHCGADRQQLKVKTADASVYVDGFYVGIVDDFDGALQRLRLERGPHRIEIRSPQHQPLAVDVMIQEDFTITYRGELEKR